MKITNTNHDTTIINTTINNPPLVSIVMCTYNGNKYIDEQIQSIIKQDYRPIEIIIVDDCSTDNTWEILQGWQSKYPDLFRLYLNETNLGYNKNFEKGIQLAKGAFIAISDQDDIWKLEKIHSLVTTLQKIPTSMMVHCKNVSMKNGQCNYSHVKLKKFFKGSDVREMFLKSHIAGHAMLFSRDLLNYIFPFPEGIIYDWWLSVNACCLGEILLDEGIYVMHRIHESNSATGESGKTNSSNFLSIDKILDLFLGIKIMKPSDQIFLKTLYEKIRLNNTIYKGNINWSLLLFVLRHRSIIYAHKKRLFPIISTIKHSLRLSKQYPLVNDLRL